MSFVDVTVGVWHACAVAAAGGLYCWGQNGQGQLGDGGTTDRTTPVEVAPGTSFVDVDAGYVHTCAVTAGGAVLCWGGNGRGRVGDGTTDQRNAPVDVTPPGETIAAVSAGEANSCAVATDGTAYCWGGNWDGEVGIGTTNASVPTPSAVLGGHTFASVSVGYEHVCGLTTGGAARCWGDNGMGQFGNGIRDDASAPTPGALGLSLVSLSAGEGYSCGVTATGEGHCWGQYSYGILGNGKTAYALNPVQIFFQ
jgi:alpha-tubulin suppressor-like RCC1 family protein